LNFHHRPNFHAIERRSMAMTMVATLFHELAPEMALADYRLRKVVKPLPAPDRNFRMCARPRQRAAGLAQPKPVSEEVSLAAHVR
jgi:hypothetical protein